MGIEFPWRRNRKLETPPGVRGSAVPDLNSARDELSRQEMKALRKLEEPIRNIARELHAELDTSAYDLIVGDDRAGRIPTLMLGYIATSLADMHGRKGPLVRFFTGSRYLSDDELNDKKAKLGEAIENIKKTATDSGRTGDRVLVVTEMVAAGRSLKPIVESLVEGGYKPDVAALNTKSTAGREIAETGEFLGVRVVKGTDKYQTIYEHPVLSGLVKDQREIYSESIGEEMYGKVRAARSIVKDLSSKIVREEFGSDAFRA